MHEFAIAESVIETITARTGMAAVHEVHLEVGRLSGVQADALRFCFELAAQGTAVDGAELSIDEPPGVGRCADCRLEFSVDDLILLCACGSADIEVLSGDQLRIMSVAVAA
jgi:hydrogenase nickel incorporation protein HypA/HybF